MHRAVVTLLACCPFALGAPAPIYKDVKPPGIRGHYNLVWNGTGDAAAVFDGGTYYEVWNGGHYTGVYSYDKSTCVLTVTYSKKFVKNGREYESGLYDPHWYATFKGGVWVGKTKYGGTVRMVRQKGS